MGGQTSVFRVVSNKPISTNNSKKATMSLVPVGAKQKWRSVLWSDSKRVKKC